MIGVIIFLGLGGAVFLAIWDIPAPVTQIERVISKQWNQD